MGVIKKISGANSFLVAASDAPAKLKSRADYVCDGTNDEVQIQAALNALPSFRGMVSLTSGTFSIGATITVKDYQKIKGAGKSTILEAINGLNDNIFTGYTDTPNRYTEITDMKIDGNKGNQSSGHAIRLFAPRQALIKNIWFYDVYDYAVYLAGDGDNLGWFTWVDQCEMDLCGNGIYAAYSEHNFFINNVISYMDGYGIRALSDMDNIVGNQLDHCGNVTIRIEFGAGLWRIAGNYIDRPQVDGISVYGATKCQVIDNYFDLLEAGYSAIVMDGADNCIVSNNRVTQGGGAGCVGIKEATACDDNIYEGNMLSNVPTAISLHASSTGTIVRNNIGHTPDKRAGAALLVAAVDAPADVIARADYKCDGTADQVQIQAALAACNAVVLSAGSFNIAAPIVLSDNMSVEGQGIASTTLTLVASTNDNMFESAGAVAYTFFCRLEKMRLEGNKANNASGHCIYAQCAHTWRLRELHVKEAPDIGVLLEGNSSYFALNNYVENCRIENTTNDGIKVGAYAPNNHIVGNIIGGTDNYSCIEVQNDEILIRGNHIHSAGGDGVSVNSDKMLFENNIIESSGGHGMDLESTADENRIIGNLFFNNTDDGVNVDGDRNVLIGNRCYDTQGTKTQDYGIDIGATADATLVIGNHLTENDTGGLRNAGTNTKIVGNSGNAVNSEEYSKSITIENPGDAEDLSIIFTNKAITITEMRAVLIGSATPSVTWTLRHHATDRSNAGTEVVTAGTTTTSVTAGSDVTAFDDATIPADSFVWLETTAQSGTVTELSLTIFYTIDAG